MSYQPRSKLEVDFSRKLRDWDGFGVTYVEVQSSPDYEATPQDYGGFTFLSEDDRQQILGMIFGANGLKPGLVKMLLDPWHQAGPESDYDHTTSTKWMRYFVNQGLARTQSYGGNLEILVGLHSPPGWMTKQKFLTARDLDPVHKIDCAKYMISWAKYLREEEGLPVKYISVHNEGADKFRWSADGSTSRFDTGGDYDYYCPVELVVDFLKIMRGMLDSEGMQDVGITSGETGSWRQFWEYGYADAIADDPEAMKNLGLITSHGFGPYAGDMTSLGNDILRAKNPGLHSWVTSMAWGNKEGQELDFINQIRLHIYEAKVNGIIPWTIIQCPSQRIGWGGNTGTGFMVDEKGNFIVKPNYYFFKQVCRAGQPGMAVARAISKDSQLCLIAFSGNGTGNPDAFVLVNLSERPKMLDVKISGSLSKSFNAYRTCFSFFQRFGTSAEKYASLGDFNASNGTIAYIARPRSVTTFFAKESKD